MGYTVTAVYSLYSADTAYTSLYIAIHNTAFIQRLYSLYIIHHCPLPLRRIPVMTVCFIIGNRFLVQVVKTGSRHKLVAATAFTKGVYYVEKGTHLFM